MHKPSLGAKLLAEFIGTFTLIAIGVGAVLLNTAGKMDLLGVALAHGLVIAVMVTAVGHVSGGHFNPAVSTTMIALRKMPGVEGVLYIITQLVAAVLAAWFVKTTFPLTGVKYTTLAGAKAVGENGTLGAVSAKTTTVFDKFAAVSLSPGTTPWHGMLLEAFGTFVLVWVVWAVAVDRDGAFGKVAGLPIGFAIAMDILMIGPLTGGTMNPARWFGPNAIAGDWTNAWVWIVGPLLGALVAGAAYHFVMLAGKGDDEIAEADKL